MPMSKINWSLYSQGLILRPIRHSQAISENSKVYCRALEHIDFCTVCCRYASIITFIKSITLSVV